MKFKTTILLIGLIAIVENVQGQTKFGFKAGLNYVNNVYVNTPDGSNGDNKYRFGYHAGIFGSFELSSKLSLRPEFLFSNKGYKFDKIAGSQPAGGGGLHLNYLNLPLLVGYEIIDRMSLMFGPEFGYLLSAKSKFDSETIDVKDNFDNDFDFGLSAGLGYSLNEKIILDLRYTHGLSSVVSPPQLTDENGIPIANNNEPKLQNRAFQFSVSYRLK